MNETMHSMDSSGYFESFLGSSMAERSSFSSRPTTSSSFNKEGTPLSSSEDALSQFTLPNCVQLPSTSQSMDPDKLPKKVRGDLDLSGAELMPFLFKAADRLHEVKDKQAKAEGIKKRFYQLQSMILEDRIPENYVRGLNYVVDSIEYENYQLAWEHYGRFVQNIPEEISKTWFWLSSLKLLITELRGAQRTRSAGSKLRNQ